MNILYIHTHDTGRYIQPYGYGIETPNLMNFAKKATLFRQAFCAGPTCSPSRAGLLTGMAPHSCGIMGLAHRGFEIEDYDKHLVQFLNKHGYETVLCGVQHESVDVSKIGYDKILGKKRTLETNKEVWDTANAEKAAEYLKSQKDKPFFLSFGMQNTHRPFTRVDEDINPDYMMPPTPIADMSATREDMAAFITSVKVVDKCVGTVLKALEDSGLRDRTMVIFTTDHGIAFPRMKCTLYDSGIGVSLIMDFPGNMKKGKVVDALVSQLDIYPTVCELLNLNPPEWLQGKSMLPLFFGEAKKIRDEIFSEVTFHSSYEPMRCIRTDGFKLIKHFDTDGSMVPSHMDDSPSKSFLLNKGMLKETKEEIMLFDLFLDPVERINVVDDVRYNGILKDLEGRLASWMLETSDPLLTGKVEKPDGTRINKISCLSNKEEDYM